MNKQKDCIELQLLKEITNIVCNSSGKGLKRRISAAGHFNRSIFTPEKYINIRLKTFYRIVINLCMDQDDKKAFLEIWNKIGETIYNKAEKCGELLNDAHKRRPITKKGKDE